MSSGSPVLRGRRFAVRFLGRPRAWIWLGATLVPGAAAWAWARHALRGFAGDERTWFLWSGGVVTALFVATLAFVFRKWAVKVPAFRNRGRAPVAMADACWAEIQTINRNVAKGAYGSDAEILAAAEEVLRRFSVERIERPEIATMRAGSRDVRFVRLRKREAFGRLEAWMEMHAGIGVAACVGVWFHADGVIRHPVGWLLLLGSGVVLVTGLVLAVQYRVLPERLAKETTEIPFEEAGVARENYDASIAGVLATLPDDVRALAGDLRPQAAAQTLRAVAERFPDHADTVRDLFVLAGTRDELLRTTARARAIAFQMKLWRWIHVPVSVLVFFAILLHVLLVLYR